MTLAENATPRVMIPATGVFEGRAGHRAHRTHNIAFGDDADVWLLRRDGTHPLSGRGGRRLRRSPRRSYVQLHIAASR